MIQIDYCLKEHTNNTLTVNTDEGEFLLLGFWSIRESSHLHVELLPEGDISLAWRENETYYRLSQPFVIRNLDNIKIHCNYALKNLSLHVEKLNRDRAKAEKLWEEKQKKYGPNYGKYQGR